MKQFISIFILLFLCLKTFSQKVDTIIISKNNIDKVKDSTISFPASFLFDDNFKDYSFKVVNAKNINNIVTKSKNPIKFGTCDSCIQKGLTYYEVNINTDSSIVPSFKKIKNPWEGLKLKDSFIIVLVKDKDSLNIGHFKIQKNTQQGAGNSLTTSIANLNYKPGYLFYDAIELNRIRKQLEDTSVKKEGINILQHYGITKEKTSNWDGNTFFKKGGYFNDFYNSNEVQNATEPSFTSIISSIGGLDVTNIADGLAKFLVKRTKAELSMAFFDKLKDAITNTKNKDLSTLFPQTATLLGAMGNEIYNYEAYVQNLREAFKEDINSLPKNIPQLVNNSDYTSYFTTHQDLKAFLLSACYIANSIQEQQHPGDILDNFPIQYLDSLPKYCKGSIQTLQLISTSLRDTANSDSSAYWVSIKKVRELINDKDAFKIYLGLLLQEMKNKYDSIRFSDTTTLYSLLNKVNFDNDRKIYTAYKTYIQGFAAKVDVLNKMIKNYSKPANDSAALELYDKYFKASVDMIEYCTTVSNLPDFSELYSEEDFLTKLKPFFNASNSMADLVMDINRRNYSAAINQTVNIYSQIFNVDSNYNKSLTNLAKYGGFMSAVATAKNSDDVESAIEAFALPAGSSRIKRETPFNVSVNAYCGLYTGYEKIKGIDGNCWSFNSGGVTAPIGIAVSWGHSLFFFRTGKENWKSNKRGWSSSIFISFIDIGALAAFRFTNDSIKLTNVNSTDTATTATSPTIQLKNIFSPGLFLSIGIPKCPLSVNLGAQVGPNLRAITLVNNTPNYNFDNKMYWRFSISLCVDLPLLNLYTKSK